MKKTLIAVALIGLIVPQVAFASWWNPLSWFDNALGLRIDVIYSFSKEHLKNLWTKIETKLDEVQPGVTDEKDTTTAGSKPAKTTTMVKPIEKAPVIEIILNDFIAECIFSKDPLDEGDRVDLTLNVRKGSNRDYEIVWDEKYLYRELTVSTASFKPTGTGKKIISATVTRKADGYSKVIECPIQVNSLTNDPSIENVSKATGEVLGDDFIVATYRIFAKYDDIDRDNIKFNVTFPNATSTPNTYVRVIGGKIARDKTGFVELHATEADEGSLKYSVRNVTVIYEARTLSNDKVVSGTVDVR